MKKGAPQVEDGYTRLANELLEALCKWKCRNTDIRLVLAVFRLTYGIHGRKKARIENQQLADMTAMPIYKVCQVRRRLVKMKVIKVATSGNQRTLTYSFNKYYKTWKKLPPAATKTTGGKGSATSGNDDATGGNGTLLKENIKDNLKENGASEPPAPPPPAKIIPPYKKIIEYLNLLTGSSYNDQNESTRGQIRARFRTGYTEQDFYDVISVKTDQWLGDSKMTQYLRPDTLFRPRKFDAYLQEAKRSKNLAKSEKQKVRERRYKIAAGILRESGQEACLRYCQDNKIDAEDFKLWISKLTEN